MNDEKATRTKRLFLAALEVTATDRDAWLVEQCCGDEVLLAKVRLLLKHDAPENDPLERGLDGNILLSAGLLPTKHGLHVRCPHCTNPVELLDDQQLAEINCASCGSRFNLIAREDTKSYLPSKDERIGHYNLVETVGVGAFGSVFRAFDEMLDRTVAIKVPRQGKLSTAEAERFLREARTAAQLRHPNIVSVHEVGRDGDRIYIASDFVDGLTLSDWLTAQRPSIRETVELCIKISTALQHAHDHGVIHRDLKPGNILLDRSNEPHLTDFGLAKRDAGEITMTMDGQVLGTPAYMPPEQAKGDGHNADARSDIYSLGVILFELLTGERPFRGNTRMLLQQVMTEEAPSLRKLDPTLPRDLETICLKCLEKDPDKRYLNASELQRDLQCTLEGKPILARPIGKLERSWRWCRRNPVAAGAMAAVALALVATSGACVSVLYQQQLKTANSELSTSYDQLEKSKLALESSLLSEQKARESEAAAEQLLKNASYLRRVSLAYERWKDNQLDAARELLRDCPENTRNWEWRYVDRLCNRPEQRVIHDAYAFSEDFSALPSVSGISANEKIAVHTHEGLKIWDLNDTVETRPLVLKRGGGTAMNLQGSVASIWEHGHPRADSVDITLWDTTSGKLLGTLRPPVGVPKQITDLIEDPRSVKIERATMAFSRDGSLLASCINYYRHGKERDARGSSIRVPLGFHLQLWDLQKRRALGEWKRESDNVQLLSVGNNGESITSILESGEIKTWPTAAVDRPATTVSLNNRGEARIPRSQSLSRDGLLLMISPDSTLSIWQTSDGQKLRQWPVEHLGQVSSLSPDGKWVANTSHGVIRIYDVTTGRHVRAYHGHAGRITGLQFSLDSRKLVSVSGPAVNNSIAGSGKFKGGNAHDNTVRVWDALSEPQVDRLTIPLHRSLSMDQRDTTDRIWQPSLTSFRQAIPIDWSADLQWLVFSDTTDDEFSIRLWNVKARKEVQRFNGHAGEVLKLAFSQDGTRMASCGKDATIRVWNVESGQSETIVHGVPYASEFHPPDDEREPSADVSTPPPLPAPDHQEAQATQDQYVTAAETAFPESATIIKTTRESPLRLLRAS